MDSSDKQYIFIYSNKLNREDEKESFIIDRGDNRPYLRKPCCPEYERGKKIDRGTTYRKESPKNAGKALS